MILYHGSNIAITEIDLSKSKPNKDFGKGFYLSDDEHQAMEMAKFKSLTLGGEPYVSRFEFDETILMGSELKVKRFDSYSEGWALFVLANRNSAPEAKAHDFDIVYGPIADDKVGAQIRRYEFGDITLQQFIERLKFIKGITFQYFFGSERAISHLKRID